MTIKNTIKKNDSYYLELINKIKLNNKFSLTPINSTTSDNWVSDSTNRSDLINPSLTSSSNLSNFVGGDTNNQDNNDFEWNENEEFNWNENIEIDFNDSSDELFIDQELLNHRLDLNHDSFMRFRSNFFEFLGEKGILAKGNIGCCSNCGTTIMKNTFEVLQNNYIGYIFYHKGIDNLIHEQIYNQEVHIKFPVKYFNDSISINEEEFINKVFDVNNTFDNIDIEEYSEPNTLLVTIYI